MGFVKDIADPGGYFDAFSGKDAADAAKSAAELQAASGAEALAELKRSKEEGLGFFQPYSDVGLAGTEQANFLTDPNAQVDFLKNNPLFQMGLDNANEQTLGLAAAQGRLSSGDTLQQLNQNALLTAAPLISDQKNSIAGLLDFGGNIATNQANTALGVGSQASGINTDIGSALAAGQVGAANAQAQGAQNVASLAGTIASFFSDPALKSNVKRTGKENGYNVYTWYWNDKAEALGLRGTSSGVMADEVKDTNPEAVTMEQGFMKVNYDAIGVSANGYRS